MATKPALNMPATWSGQPVYTDGPFAGLPAPDNDVQGPVMRHDNLEHRRTPPKPFTIGGTLPVVLHCLGMPEDTTDEALEQAFLDDREFMHSGIPCAVTKWKCHVESDGLRVYVVSATPLRFVTPKSEARHDPQIAADPWVTVGTTAVDGTLAELAEAFNVPACAVGASVAGLIEGGHVVEVRGRHLRPMEWVPPQDGAAIVLCDVVRRQSEIEAEARQTMATFAAEWRVGKVDGDCRLCGAFDCLSTHGTCARCCDRAENPCPECDPHGNAGRVLLLESWVECTTCRPRPTHLAVDGGEGPPLVIDLEKDSIDVPRGRVRVDLKMVDKASDKLRAAYPTDDDVRSSLSTSLIAEGASSEVAQRGVRAFMEALQGPVPYNDATIEAIGAAMPSVNDMHAAIANALQVPRDILFGATPSSFSAEQARMAEHLRLSWLHGLRGE